jgi:mono/diheme cytochrome c family protein
MGSPNTAPALFLYGVKDAEIRDAIANGIPESVMPPFGDRLKPEEIDALVNFLKTPPAK